MNLMWLIHVLALLGCIHHVMCNDIYFKYVNTWETVILPCQAGTSVIIKRWHRENDYLFQGGNANLNAARNNRYAIVGNQNIGEYNLQITNTTEKDNGTYVCYVQLPNNIISTKYLLIVKDPEIVPVQTISSTKESSVHDTSINSDSGQSTLAHNEQSTDRYSLKQITSMSMSTYPNEDKLSTLSEKRMSTENNMEEPRQEGGNETGLSYREMFYYGMLAAGLVVVLIMSILCHAFVNRKCKGPIPRPTENIAKDDSSDTIEENNENTEITERNEITSLYETINENDMLTDSSIALKWSITKAAPVQAKRTPIALPERLYSEIDDIDVVTSNEKDKSNISLHGKVESSKAADMSDSLQHLKRRKNVSESPSSSEESVYVTESKDDGYLHPYVALNKNEMEYLHSYSTPCLVSVEKGAESVTSSGPEPANDYYTDGFSSKEVITQV